MTKLDERENESPTEDKLLSAHNNGNHNTLTLSHSLLFATLHSMQCNLFGFSGLHTCFWLDFNNVFHIIANIFFYIEITFILIFVIMWAIFARTPLYSPILTNLINAFIENCEWIQCSIYVMRPKAKNFHKYYFCDIIKWYEEIKIYSNRLPLKPIRLKTEIRHQIYNR